MVYSTFADCSKKTINWAVENTFPRNPAVATVTGAVSWYGYRVGLTYAPNIINTWICAQIGYVKGLIAAPLITPSLTPYIALYISIGASFAVSITLNLITAIFLKVKGKWNASDEKEKPTEESLNVKPGTRVPASKTKALSLEHHLKTRTLVGERAQQLPAPI